MKESTDSSALESVVLAWPEAVLLCSADGRVLLLNDAAKALVPASRGDAGTASLSDLLGDASAAALLVPEGGGGLIRIGDDTSPAGRPVIRARSARLPSGEFFIRLEDATEEHRLRSHLEHAERLASIGELLSSVAHELANPLTTVLGYADLLLTDGDASVPRVEIERIRTEAMRCRRIVGNLLDLSRAENFEMRPLSLAQVVERVAEFRRYAAKVGDIELVCESAGDLPAINGDQHRLVQAVLNLVTNAEDAVRDRKTGRRIVIRARPAGAGAAIEVEDNGTGVPEAIRAFVFEPFFTTKPRGRGTGLGLSLVRATAKAHGGSVRVGAAESGGALFVMELPAAT